MNPFSPLAHLLPASWRSLLAPAAARSEQLQYLARILAVATGELAGLRFGSRYHYRPFTVAKTDGRERRLLAPSPALKALQRCLLDGYLAQLPVHPCATAFHFGASIVHNARRHAGQTLIATADLRDFFESTRGGRVRAFFAQEGWRDDALHTLMRLCVYRDQLPQGAPTSPCLSNLVNRPLDRRLASLARRSGATYTRYGDDLTFSWGAVELPGGFQRAVEDACAAAGYEIQPCKGWRVRHARERPMVTGLVLTGDGRVRVPWSMRWRLWYWRWQAWWLGDAAARARFRGYQGFVRMVD